MKPCSVSYTHLEKVANGAGLTTDIFVYSNDTLRNLALDGEDTASHSTYRPVAVLSLIHI